MGLLWQEQSRQKTFHHHRWSGASPPKSFVVLINKILKSTAAVFSNSILTSVLAILLVPIILSAAVGQERYGLIVLAIFLSVKNGILGIFMFGIQSAVIKFVAEYQCARFILKNKFIAGHGASIFIQ